MFLWVIEGWYLVLRVVEKGGIVFVNCFYGFVC